MSLSFVKSSDDESILSIYSEKTGQSNEQLEEWMNEEKWFTADEAVEFGFADSVKRDNAESVESEESIEDIINSKVAIAMAILKN